LDQEFPQSLTKKSPEPDETRVDRTEGEFDQRLRTALDTMLDCVGVYRAVRDAEGRITDFRVEYVNDAACANNRLSREEQVGRTMGELFAAYRSSGLFDEHVRLVETREPVVKDEYVYKDVFGGGHELERAFDVRNVPLDDGFVAAWRDVTEQRRSELAMRTLQDRLEAALAVSGGGAWQWQVGEDVVELDGTLRRMHGFASDGALTLDDALSVVHPDDRERLRAEARRALAGEGPLEGHFRTLLVDAGPAARPRWFLCRGDVVREAAGRVAGLHGTLVDVTALLEARRRAERLQAFATALATAHGPEGVWDALLEHGREAIGAPAAAVVRPMPGDPETLEVVRSVGFDVPQLGQWMRFPLAADAPVAEAMRLGEPVWVDTVADAAARYPSLAPFFQATGYEGWLAVPFVLGEQGERRLLGALGVAYHTPRVVSAEERDFLFTLGQQAAQALDRARLTQALHAEREELVRLIEALPVMVTVYDPSLATTAKGVIQFNRAFVETLGWTEEDARGGDIMALCYPDPAVRERTASHMQAPDAEGGRVRWLEIPTRAKDGRTVPILWGNVRLGGERQIGVGVDLTALARAEAAVDASEARYRSLFESLDHAFCVIEVLFDAAAGPAPGHPVDYRFLEVNSTFEQHTGLVGATGRTAREMAPGLEQHWFETYGRVAVTGEPVRFQQGSETLGRWFDVFAFRVGIPEARQVGILFTDVTSARQSALERERLLADAERALRQAEEARQEAEEARTAADLEQRRLATILEQLPVGVVVAEAPSGRIVQLNAAVQRIWGVAVYSPTTGEYGADYVGYHHGPGPDAGRQYESHEWPLARAMAHGEVVTDEVADVVRPDGTHVLVSLSAAPVRGADGQIVGGVVASLDATERERTLEAERRAHAEAEKARLAAERANLSKSEFLATMSHELRTPLNAIAGHVQLVEMELHGPITEAQRDALGRVQRAQRHLLGLINDVLNYTKLEAGKVEYDLQPVLMSDVMADVLPLVESQATSLGLTFTVRLLSRPVLVLADREKLGQVLLNLLSNAIKFTPGQRADGSRGHVTIECVAGSGPSSSVEIHVRDNGIGIPAERLESIFEPFVQVRTDLTRQHGGTGLGLAISRDLMRGMGGSLTIASAVDDGTTFTIGLQRAPGP